MNDELIVVEKDGEQISVHPLALDDHKRLGWKVVEPLATEEEAADQVSSEDAQESPKRKRKSS